MWSFARLRPLTPRLLLYAFLILLLSESGRQPLFLLLTERGLDDRSPIVGNSRRQLLLVKVSNQQEDR